MTIDRSQTNVLEASEERFRLAQSAAQIGTWEWDAQGDTRSLSPELHRIFGTDADDPDNPEVWAARVHPEDRELLRRQMEEAQQTGHIEVEYRYNHPDLGLRWLYCKGARVGDQTRLFGIVQDITARKAAEEASHRLAAIVESSDDAIVSKDLNGIVTSWNACAERMFGYTSKEMVGSSITRIIPPELHGDELRILQTIARGERIEHFETTRVKKTGETIDVSLTISPVKDQTGKIIGAAKIARDITQQKKAERILRTSERLASVGRLAATVAHEINNPLEAVMNLVYLAKERADQPDVRKFLVAAEEELERISHLTKQTLGFYRETKGASPIKVSAVLSPLISVFSSRSRNKGIDVRPEIRQDPDIYAVPGEIRQLIANLLSNSIDAVDSAGRIRVRVSATREWTGQGRCGVRISVADSGPGIPESARSQLFEPFFTTKQEVGTGLGLWVCKSIVEKHQGFIRVKSSTTPGKSGTVFSVFLPAAQQQMAAPKNLKQAV